MNNKAKLVQCINCGSRYHAFVPDSGISEMKCTLCLKHSQHILVNTKPKPIIHIGNYESHTQKSSIWNKISNMFGAK